MTHALAAVLARSDIWRGDRLATAPMPALKSGFPLLDAELPGGGWPRGQLTELLSPHGGCGGIGELTLLLPALAALTAAGETVVLISPPYRLHAPAWVAAGINLDALHLIFPRRPRDVLWASVEAVRCGAVAATLAWPDSPAGTGLPSGSLRRLHVAAVEGGGCVFLFRPVALGATASPAPLRLQLQAAGRRLRVHLLKRRGPPARQPLLLDIPRPGLMVDTPHVMADPGFPGAPIPRTNSAVAL